MKVLVVHDRYLQPGGEEAVEHAEIKLLRDAGHDVITWERDNTELAHISRLRAARDAVWSRDSSTELRGLLDRHRPDVVHFHNTFPRISPAAIRVAAASPSAVVQTLHNYRLACPNALLLRDGNPCTDCVGKRVPLPAVQHGCYRDSRAQSGVVTAMLATHRAMGTYTDKVDAFITLTDFARDIMIRAGLAGERVHVKPNFLHDAPPPGTGPGEYLLFVGRLAPEKGINMLIDAWRTDPTVPLVIAGDGPLRGEVDALARQHPDLVSAVGHIEPDEVHAYMQRARALIMPSIWYETFGLTIIESFACRRPVIVANHGAIGELVDDGTTGWHVRHGDASDLSARMRAVWDDPAEAQRRGAAARATFEQRFTASTNIEQLEQVYGEAIGRARLMHG